MKFTNSESVEEVIVVPTEGYFGLWDIRLYCTIGDDRAYNQVYNHLYIPRILLFKHKIIQEIER